MDPTRWIEPTQQAPMPPPPRSLSRRTQISVVLIAAAVLAVVLLLGHWVIARGEVVETSTATTTPNSFKPTSQQLATLKIASVQEISFPDVHETDGSIALDDDLTTPVFSPFTGRVVALYAKAGEIVPDGAPLFAVDASEFVQGQNDLITAVGTLKTARAQLNLARTTERRQHALYQAQGGALKDWQQSQVDLATAQAAFEGAQTALAAVHNRLRILGRSNSEIDALAASRNTATMSPQVVVRAPLGGTIVQRQVGPGQYINSVTNGAANPAFTISDLSKVWLVANVRETDAPLMHLGDPVDVHVMSFPGRVFKAKLTYVAPSIDPTTHRLPVHAEVENPDGALKPNMFASFAIMTGAAVTAPAVPQDAVVYEGSTAHVWVANDDKTLALRMIKPGRTRGQMVEVLSGLRAGDRVVTSGSLFIDRAAAGD
jgi:cobalt-zinc-cadmium efflux system membrane fusion protein